MSCRLNSISSSPTVNTLANSFRNFALRCFSLAVTVLGKWQSLLGGGKQFNWCLNEWVTNWTSKLRINSNFGYTEVWTTGFGEAVGGLFGQLVNQFSLNIKWMYEYPNQIFASTSFDYFCSTWWDLKFNMGSSVDCFSLQPSSLANIQMISFQRYRHIQTHTQSKPKVILSRYPI